VIPAATIASMAAPNPWARMSYLDTGALKVGVNMSEGGAVTHLAYPGSGPKIINSAVIG
jgi:hypothetical protein